MSPDYLLSSTQYFHPFLVWDYPRINLVLCVTLHCQVQNAKSLPPINMNKVESFLPKQGKKAKRICMLIGFFCVLSDYQIGGAIYLFTKVWNGIKSIHYSTLLLVYIKNFWKVLMVLCFAHSLWPKVMFSCLIWDCSLGSQRAFLQYTTVDIYKTPL